MNEQRLQAYLTLIQQLLNCPNGEEENILQANSELVDAGLVEVMGQVADTFAQQGEENNANWLRNLAANLGRFLQEAANPNQERIQAYWKLIQQLLQCNSGQESEILQAIALRI